MKRLLFVCLLGFTNCFSVDMKVTKIIPELNLYIFDGSYVMKSSRMIERFKVGHYIDVHIDNFVEGKIWDQEINVINAGRIWQFGDLFSSYYNFKQTCTFTAMGRVQKGSMNIESFEEFLTVQEDEALVASYLEICSSYDYYGGHHTIEIIETSSDWLLENFQELSVKFNLKIYPIYSFSDQTELVGLYHICTKKDVFNADKIQGIWTLKTKEKNHI